MWRRRTQRGDAGFGGGDKGIELRDLFGVVALLVFAEAKQIRFVLRPPAMVTLPAHVNMLEAIVLPNEQLYVGRG